MRNTREKVSFFGELKIPPPKKEKKKWKKRRRESTIEWINGKLTGLVTWKLYNNIIHGWTISFGLSKSPHAMAFHTAEKWIRYGYGARTYVEWFYASPTRQRCCSEPWFCADRLPCRRIIWTQNDLCNGSVRITLARFIALVLELASWRLCQKIIGFRNDFNTESYQNGQNWPIFSFYRNFVDLFNGRVLKILRRSHKLKLAF